MPSHTILIVEDEPALLRVLADELRDNNFRVLTAADGQEGLTLALKHHPDLLLVDVVMPGMDGLTMLKHIRADKWGSTVPIIMLTNISDPNKIDESYHRGIYEYIVKADWQINDVVRIVKRKLALPIEA